MAQKFYIHVQSKTGNTALLAHRIQEYLTAECGTCTNGIDRLTETDAADLIFAGFWTDRGTCDEVTAAYLKGLRNKKVFLFGTAGFGGSPDYFSQIICRAAKNLDDSNTLAGSFMCQGRMPDTIRTRYEAMAAQQPEQAAPMLANFDRALTHPDSEDFMGLELAIRAVMEPNRTQ